MWEELRRIRRNATGLWVVGGDFNVIRYANERLWGDTNDREEFNNLISDLHLIKVPMGDRLYTRSNMRERPSLAKLDWVFIYEEWDDKFGLPLAYSIRRPTSDHVPICLSLGKDSRKTKRISDLRSGGSNIKKLGS